VAAVDATLAAIKKALKKGDAVTLVGFGTFNVKKRKPVQAETLKQVRPLK